MRLSDRLGNVLGDLYLVRNVWQHGWVSWWESGRRRGHMLGSGRKSGVEIDREVSGRDGVDERLRDRDEMRPMGLEMWMHVYERWLQRL